MFETVAKLSELPAGRGTVVEAGGYALAVFRAAGEVYAIDNACPHAEGPLAEGDLQGSTVYCPWHGWAFDLPSGRCRQGAHVRSYPTRVVGDEVQVDLSGTRGPD
ncbi:MAG: Rieske 2Fe-2S domain-containing protein [Planctomycetes bacterium]|nr:Rieske 2Fe-2S domain-containing protein [Planctomycetota bacterium]